MKRRLAIVGTGISGIACAYYLKERFDITVFDKNNYLGGHTHTHDMGGFTLDTGFIVFNMETYPNLMKLFAELNIEKQKSEMTFSVYNKKTGLQFSGTSYSHLFAQKRNIFNIKYLKFLLDINKFFKHAHQDYKEMEGSNETIRSYCKRKGLSKYFIDNYLAPMSAAVWSTSQNDIYDFPIGLLIPFFRNHGLLGMDGQFQWYTVKGGSNSYTKKIIENSNFDIHINEEVLEVEESANSVSIKTAKQTYSFDAVILASHADESLKIAKINNEKKKLLEQFTYTKNRAVLHTDSSLMPSVKKVWSAWNQLYDKDKTSTTYWLNILQKPKTDVDYFLSINSFQKIDPSKIVKELEYMHPLYTVENFTVQKELQKINRGGKIYFAGSYFGFGFHEDGLKSALEIVKQLK